LILLAFLLVPIWADDGRKPGERLRDSLTAPPDDRGKQAKESYEKLKGKQDNPLKRTLTGENAENVCAVKSVQQNGADRAEYRFEFRYGGAPMVNVEYRTKTGDTKSLYRVAVGFLELVEFNANTAWNESKQRLPLDKNGGSWVVAMNDDTLNNVPIKSVNATWTGKAGVVFSLEFYVLGDAVFSNSGLLTNSLKYSIAIWGWKYSLTNSQLGLVHFVRTKSVTKEVSSGLNLNGGNFTWNDTVLADGKPAKVRKLEMKRDDKSTEGQPDKREEGEGDNCLVLAFDGGQANYIYWDPVIDIADPAIDPNNTSNNDKATKSAAGALGVNWMGLVLAVAVGLFLI